MKNYKNQIVQIKYRRSTDDTILQFPHNTYTCIEASCQYTSAVPDKISHTQPFFMPTMTASLQIISMASQIPQPTISTVQQS